jgi:hypothetical protein
MHEALSHPASPCHVAQQCLYLLLRGVYYIWLPLYKPPLLVQPVRLWSLFLCKTKSCLNSALVQIVFFSLSIWLLCNAALWSNMQLKEAQLVVIQKLILSSSCAGLGSSISTQLVGRSETGKKEQEYYPHYTQVLAGSRWCGS